MQKQDAASTERASGWHDDPIKGKAEDKLNRAPVAERLTDLITSNHSPESSIVYGLEGPWGCGKSSVIAMLTELLEDRKGWRVAFFTPWATAGTDGMISEFFASLLNAVPNSDTARREGFRKIFANCMMVARPVMPLIPKVGTALNNAAKAIEESLEKSWKQCFDELSKELQKLGISILVVVDDIDRLQADELLDLLKVVRLLGRFPGVDYLLAYDEQSLIEILRSPDGSGLSQARARSFMEKIVQYPLSLPPLLTGQIIKILTTRLNELLSSGRLGAGLDDSRMGGIIGTTMPSQLRTPRAIERFLAQANEEIKLHDPREIDCVDLLLAAFLRVQFPDVLSRLQDWKERLTADDPPRRGRLRGTLFSNPWRSGTDRMRSPRWRRSSQQSQEEESWREVLHDSRIACTSTAIWHRRSPTETFRTQMSGMRSKGLPMASKKTLRNCSMSPTTTAHTMC